MVNIRLVTCILASWAVVAVSSIQHEQSPVPAPAPALSLGEGEGDCSSLIYNMADCLSFLSAGSTGTKPDASCCSGFKLVLDSNAACICEALKSSASLGIELNMTKAMTLPLACGISAPSLSSCKVSLAPGSPPTGAAPSPVNPPAKNAPVPTTKSPTLKTPTITGGGAAPVPGPSPANSSAYTISISLSALFALVAAASFFILV